MRPAPLLALLLLVCLLPSSFSQAQQPSAVACVDCSPLDTCLPPSSPSQLPSAVACVDCSAPLDPLLFTLYNLREASKQQLLLEDHLFLPARRCRDCVMKHFLKAEALLEEGATLQGSASQHALCVSHAARLRALSEVWARDPSKAAEEVARSVRVLRKGLVPQSFDLRALSP
jgi:hypothetical protein